MSRIGFIGLGIMGAPMASAEDLGTVTDAARQADLALPTASLIAAARARGLGSFDHSALPTVIEKLDGRGES
ncbi:hypothetical protein [Nocardia vaccinii]|uniref:hypothetical protein n=1 Tax=Nocardia vaccinii TaxID=1822 RepID=UPI0008306A1B|nr:hypothetical protein [Nocardia vaccinii]